MDPSLNSPHSSIKRIGLGGICIYGVHANSDNVDKFHQKAIP